MRVLGTALVLLVVALLVIGFTMLVVEFIKSIKAAEEDPRRPGRPWWGSRVMAWIRRRHQARLQQEQDRVPWRSYSHVDPQTGEHLIGIHRVHHGVRVEKVELQRVPAGDHGARLEWEAVAMQRAWDCNASGS